jgi:hypothetical protein
MESKKIGGDEENALRVGEILETGDKPRPAFRQKVSAGSKWSRVPACGCLPRQQIGDGLPRIASLFARYWAPAYLRERVAFPSAVLDETAPCRVVDFVCGRGSTLLVRVKDVVLCFHGCMARVSAV